MRGYWGLGLSSEGRATGRLDTMPPAENYDTLAVTRIICMAFACELLGESLVTFYTYAKA